MRSAPCAIAWSRKALKLISALHSTSGLGVRPALYSARKLANTRSRYSAEKLTASISMPIRSATDTASTRSSRVEQYSSSSSSSQFFMKRPTTSWPARFARSAATAESTPPERPTTIFMGIRGERQKQKAGPRPRLLSSETAGYFGLSPDLVTSAGFLAWLVFIGSEGALGATGVDTGESPDLVTSACFLLAGFLVSAVGFAGVAFGASPDCVTSAGVFLAAAGAGAAGACASTDSEAEIKSMEI